MYKVKRKRGGKRKSYFSRFKGFARGVGTVARLARDVNYLRSVVNVEKKYIDIITNTTATQTGAFVLLNGCQTGTTAITRNGQSIKIVSIYINTLCSINTSASTTYIRAVLLLDKQPNGATPSQLDVFKNSSSVLSPLNISNSKRFKILAELRTTLSINGREMSRMKRFKKCRIHVEYNTGNVGDITDINTNAIYLYYMSDQSVNNPVFDFTSRVRFIDN